MASQNPILKNTGYTFYTSLVSQADSRLFQVSATLAAGDVKVAIDDGAPANLGTLPVIDADFTKRVKVVMSSGEMNGENITIIFSDAAGAEWCDMTINLQTVLQQFDILATQASVNTIDDFLDTEMAALTTAVGVIDDFLDTEVAAIKAKTDNLPTDPADASDIATATTAIAGYIDTEVASILTAVDTEVAAIKAKTDNLPAAPSAVSDIPTAGTIADAVWDEPLTQPAGVFAWAGSFRNLLNWLGALSRNKSLQTSTLSTLRNDADDGDLATSIISDDETTLIRGEWT